MDAKMEQLILVTGPTGSGKSTTLAAMIEHVNQNSDRHIITIEDPIEYKYQCKKSLIHQREVGEDVGSFADALRSALREDPDVILVGEMRDYETISAALLAAETGHLVLSTLHTTGAAQTVERIIDACPTGSQNQIRIQLAAALKGIVSQCLIPCGEVKGAARIAGTELLVATDAILNLISDGYLLATMAQNPDVMGYEGVKAAVAAIGGESLGGEVTDTGVSVVTADSLAGAEAETEAVTE